MYFPRDHPCARRDTAPFCHLERQSERAITRSMKGTRVCIIIPLMSGIFKPPGLFSFVSTSASRFPLLRRRGLPLQFAALAVSMWRRKKSLGNERLRNEPYAVTL